MNDFNKILIVNRGEIARRIMRTAFTMGYTVAVVYSSEELHADYVEEADEAYDLGTGSLIDTFLNIPKIIDIALKHSIQAIHPGYGFLSENYQFAASCELNNLVFIGPSSNNIRLMSQKLDARMFVKSLDIPMPDSVDGMDPDDILRRSARLTWPVIVKAVSGGGGKGMYVARNFEELKNLLPIAQREAFVYFGDPKVYVEEYLHTPRHIEVQILGDRYGNIVHLYERECTIQRRHQKIIEEAPAANLSVAVRDKILESALTIARSMKYESAGTIEFLLDEKQQFYFLEMNTRIQVEHPVTEKITGIDIVKEQFHIAAGYPLGFKQEDIVLNGHAMECRIYTENPFNEFQPSAGSVLTYQEPVDDLVRIDSSIKQPAEISPEFDPMISKVISHDTNRESVRIKLLKSLQEYIIHGIDTNISYLIEILNHPGFIQNRYSTSFCKDSAKMLHASHSKKLHELTVEIIAAAFLVFAFSFFVHQGMTTDMRVWQSFGYWRNLMVTELNIFGNTHRISFKKQTNDSFLFRIDDKALMLLKGRSNNPRVDFLLEGKNHVAYITSCADLYFITISGVTFTISHKDSSLPDIGKKMDLQVHNQQSHVLTPLTGKIIKVNIKIHEKVNKGDVLMVVESMKMENYILAPKEGQVIQINVTLGDRVNGQDVLAIIA